MIPIVTNGEVRSVASDEGRLPKQLPALTRSRLLRRMRMAHCDGWEAPRTEAPNQCGGEAEAHDKRNFRVKLGVGFEAYEYARLPFSALATRSDDCPI